MSRIDGSVRERRPLHEQGRLLAEWRMRIGGLDRPRLRAYAAWMERTERTPMLMLCLDMLDQAQRWVAALPSVDASEGGPYVRHWVVRSGNGSGYSSTMRYGLRCWRGVVLNPVYEANLDCVLDLVIEDFVAVLPELQHCARHGKFHIRSLLTWTRGWAQRRNRIGKKGVLMHISMARELITNSRMTLERVPRNHIGFNELRWTKVPACNSPKPNDSFASAEST